MSTTEQSKGSNIPIPTNNHPTFKRRLSLFTFGSKNESTSPTSGTGSGSGPVTGSGTRSGSSSDGLAAGSKTSTSPSDPTQLMSPIHSPETTSPFPIESDIFERSLDSGLVSNTVPKCSKCSTTRSRLCTHNSSISIQGGQFLKQEDCIPAALDATTSLLVDKEANLDEVEMVYSNRRNSSVIGLNMALGRSFTPSRKNSMYSMNSLHQQSQIQPQPLQLSSLNTQLNSPPKLSQSKSSVNFCSYADMLSNDEFSSKRPSFSQQSQSYSTVPTLQSLQAAASSNNNTNNNNNNNNSNSSNSNSPNFRYARSNTLERSNSNASTQFSLLSKQILKQQTKHKSTSQPPNSLLNKKFLISPESSDNEEILEFNRDSIGRHMSIGSNQSNKSSTSHGLLDNLDDESLVSTSMGDCLRRTHTELNTN